ncbi:hypothetical protein NQ315_009645 [Exocentrus adspersus]|uniref:Uncharacterized protein n=1 Tax=Exocentrus adspersus TaxID=1586481 RepID=A0AAV8WGC1_9CUCU|nr:hypothetical protein NQ315_009645 [Exocentrus adspersus]
MNTLIIAVFCALCVFVYARPDKYTTKYDNINVDQIIKSDRLMRTYINCLLDKGRCNPDGEELKRVLPDALHTDCSKCSEAQRKGARKIIRHLITNKRAWWDELEAKYDPERTYLKKYEQEIKKEGLRI